MIFGIDEAGKGSLIGPLVIAIAIADKKKIKELNNIKKIKDSKKLSKEEREKLFEFLTSFLDFDYILIQANEITKLMKEGKKIYDIELEYLYKLLDKHKNKLTKGYIDSFFNSKEKLLEKLKKRYKNIKFIVDYKADNKYKIVSAASIIAKVIRDKEIENIKKKIGIDFGSGYPSDEKTKKFIKDYWDLISKKYLNFIRLTWNTVKNKYYQKTLFDL